MQPRLFLLMYMSQTFTHVAFSASRRHGSSTAGLPWQRLAEQAPAKVSCSKTFFVVNSVYTNNVLNAHVHVYRPWWYYQQSFILFWDFLVF